MRMDLEPRQRAMLREMGVRVWQPRAPVAAPVQPPAPPPVLSGAAATAPPRAPPAIDSVADKDRGTRAASDFDPHTATSGKPAPARAPMAPRNEASRDPWRLGEALSLYADTARTPGPRWLVLAEMPASAIGAAAFDPFAGDAGKLLDNMLRAARLHLAGAVWLAPLVRRTSAEAAAAGPASALPALAAEARPDVILVMGRLAAQALLQSGEAFGKLRGQVHSLHGVPAVLTHDAAYLLRTPADKAKAWDDLCLAISVAAAPGSRAGVA